MTKVTDADRVAADIPKPGLRETLEEIWSAAAAYDQRENLLFLICDMVQSVQGVAAYDQREDLDVVKAAQGWYLEKDRLSHGLHKAVAALAAKYDLEK
mgnify:CR=1 FL=1